MDMKLWHRIRAWSLTNRVRRERKRLNHYVQSSAQEICAWQQEIIDLEIEVARHRKIAGEQQAPLSEDSDKVILLEQNAA